MKSWLSSPLAINYLFSLCKNGPSYQNKYLQIFKELKNKEGYVYSNQLFLSPSCNAEKQYDISNISIQNIEFGKSKDASQHITKWLNQYGSFNQVDIEKYILPGTTSLLCNISLFKDVWKCNQSSPIMNVHNSFSYTEDIKYEARMIELPMQDVDFKLVIIVPNELTSIRGLFNKLVDEGLSAAVGCVHPLFTFSTVLEAPSIDFSSENNICFTQGNCNIVNGSQIGQLQVNENGTNVSVITLLSCTDKQSVTSEHEEQLTTESPFYFAVLYKDIAVFTGRYVKQI